MLNFVVGQAKLSIYNTRKELLPVFVSMVITRIRGDFTFYSLMNNVEELLWEWSFTDALSSAGEHQ